MTIYTNTQSYTYLILYKPYTSIHTLAYVVRMPTHTRTVSRTLRWLLMHISLITLTSIKLYIYIYIQIL